LVRQGIVEYRTDQRKGGYAAKVLDDELSHNDAGKLTTPERRPPKKWVCLASAERPFPRSYPRRGTWLCLQSL